MLLQLLARLLQLVHTVLSVVLQLANRGRHGGGAAPSFRAAEAGDGEVVVEGLDEVGVVEAFDVEEGLRVVLDPDRKSWINPRIYIIVQVCNLCTCCMICK